MARFASSAAMSIVGGVVLVIAASACGDDTSGTGGGSGGSGASAGEGGREGEGGEPSDGSGGDAASTSRASTGTSAGDGGSGGGQVTTGGSGGDGGAGSGGEGPVLPEGPPCEVNGREGVCADASLCTVEGYAPVPGFCEGPAEIQCCAPLPDGGVCDPDAHPLPNAGIDEAPGVGGCPSGMIPITADFCVDQYEGFLVTYPDELPVSPYFNPEEASMMAKSAAGAVPQGYIEQVQAEDACLAAGKRLCSDVEWLRACEGPDADTYPYGDTRQPGVCNDARDQHPAIEYFGTTDDWIWSELGHPCLNQLEDGLATSGEYEGCETFEGAFDMMGNLHEWTDNPAGTFRGGFYVDTVLNGNGCLYATTAHDIYHWDYSTGFRCCADR